METKQIITPPAPGAVRIDDQRTLRVPSAHWAEISRNYAAAAAVVGTVCEIAVPKTLYNRRVYSDFKGQNQLTTSQFILGTLEFFLAGNRVLTLPFEFFGRAGDKPYGLRLNASFETAAAGNHLVAWAPTGQPGSGPIYLAPFEGRLACDRIVLVARAGTADAAQVTTALLACYSEGEIE